MGKFSLAMKLISEEYKLSPREVQVLTRRMLADEYEFERVWSQFNNKSRAFKGGVDKFKDLLKELLA
jgi:hypothetical protein